MSLIIATGTNIGDKKKNLCQARDKLSKIFHFIAASNIYTSEPVEYLKQPDFYNQVLEFENPNIEATLVLEKIKKIELEMGRVKTIPKGPRVIDLDIIFMGDILFKNEILEIPHPAALHRSFVMLPFRELPFYQTIKEKLEIPETFDSMASPITT